MDTLAFGYRFLLPSALRTFTAQLLPMPGARKKYAAEFGIPQRILFFCLTLS